jgi:hypothetical protein
LAAGLALLGLSVPLQVVHDGLSLVCFGLGGFCLLLAVQLGPGNARNTETGTGTLVWISLKDEFLARFPEEEDTWLGRLMSNARFSGKGQWYVYVSEIGLRAAKPALDIDDVLVQGRKVDYFLPDNKSTGYCVPAEDRESKE